MSYRIMQTNTIYTTLPLSPLVLPSPPPLTLEYILPLDTDTYTHLCTLIHDNTPLYTI